MDVTYHMVDRTRNVNRVVQFVTVPLFDSDARSQHAGHAPYRYRWFLARVSKRKQHVAYVSRSIEVPRVKSDREGTNFD